MPTITCARCGQQKEGFERPPFPGAMGARILDGTCQDCWELWKKQQTMLINHYGLDVMDPQARFAGTAQVVEERDRDGLQMRRHARAGERVGAARASTQRCEREGQDCMEEELAQSRPYSLIL